MKTRAVMAALLAGAMLTVSLTGCGGSSKAGKGDSADDNTMRIAMVTDSGDITDQCFNQTTY